MVIELLTKRYPGMRIWLSQRISAAYMAAYLLGLLGYVCILRPSNYAQWLALTSPWWARLLSLVFFVCLLMHAWIGVRDVMRDYVFNLRLRNYLQLLVDLLVIVYLIGFMLIIVGIGSLHRWI